MDLQDKIRFTIEEIIPFLCDNERVIGSTEDKYFKNVRASEFIDNESLDWINPTKKNRQELFDKSKAGIIICDDAINIDDAILNNKCILISNNPKLTFTRIVNGLLKGKKEFGIHPTAFIHPDAEIHPEVYIGPFNYIGYATIDSGSIIHGHCYIYDQVKIGKNVIINSGTVIGSEGFGYVKDKNDEFLKFPHLAGVTIEDNVEIGSNTSIARGALSDTIIKKGAKIDNLVHIAHNVIIGEHSAVIANTMIGGSTVIGDYSWVAPSVSLRDQISIGTGVTVGMGAVVTKNIPDDETWVGSPAKPLKEFVDLQKKLKKL